MTGLNTPTKTESITCAAFSIGSSIRAAILVPAFVRALAPFGQGGSPRAANFGKTQEIGDKCIRTEKRQYSRRWIGCAGRLLTEVNPARLLDPPHSG